MATSFLAISSYMSAAPLNPNYKAEEFEFYLGDLKPKILIVEPNSKNPAVEVAKKLKIPVCEIKTKENTPSGMFDLFKNTKDFELPNEEDESLCYIHLGLRGDQSLYLYQIKIFSRPLRIFPRV